MMRTVTLALAVAGCNAVFGLHDTAPGDGSHGPDSPPDALWPRLVLMREALDGGTITTTWSASDPAPTTKVGPIGGALRDVHVDDDGGFFLPADLLAAPYRIVYQWGSGAPTEIQTSGMTGTLIVPLFGRADRTNAPPGAGLHFAPSGAPATLPGARVLTAGLWTRAGLGTISNPYDFTYNTSLSLSGALGSLDGSRGDVEVLTACVGSDPVCTTSPPSGTNAFAVNQVAMLQPNTKVTAAGTWVSSAGSLPSIAVTFNESPLFTRLNTSLGSSLFSTPSALHDGGVLASSMMPTFAQPVPGDLDIAAFLPLYETAGSTSSMAFVNPFDGAHAPAPMLPRAVAGRYATSRSYMGATLVSGFQEMVTYGGLPVTVAYDVGLAQDVMLAGAKLSGNGVSDGATVTGGGTTLPLWFATDMPVDDCVITLSAVSGGGVTPTYRYSVLQVPTPQTPLQIDGSLLLPSMDYVIGIVCRRGSRTGMDYSEPKYPFVTSTLQTAVFRVQ